METLSKQDTGYTHPYHPTAECLVFYEQGHFVGSRILWLWGKLCFGELNHYMGLLDKKESASLDLAGLCWFFCPFSPCFIFHLRVSFLAWTENIHTTSILLNPPRKYGWSMTECVVHNRWTPFPSSCLWTGMESILYYFRQIAALGL